MKLTNNYFLKKIGPDYSLIPLNGENVMMDRLLNLNETGVFIYNLIVDGLNESEILNKLKGEYEASEDILKNDLDEFINLLKNKGVIE